jgi:hypothetical protein
MRAFRFGQFFRVFGDAVPHGNYVDYLRGMPRPRRLDTANAHFGGAVHHVT